MSELAQEQAKAGAMLHAYAHNLRRTRKDWVPILDAYRASAHGFVWELTFAIDPPLYRAMRQEATLQQAKESVALFDRAPAAHQSQGLMDITATLCLTQTGASEECLRTGGQLSQEVIERIGVWKEVFSGHPWFQVSLQSELARMRENHEKIYRELSSGPAREPSTPPRVFALPVQCQSRTIGMEAWVDCDQAPPAILDRLNAFAAEYLPGVSFGLSEDGRQWLISEHDEGPVQMQQQCLAKLLSGSYGDHARGQTVLWGNQEIKPGWDVARLTLFTPPARARPPRP